MESNKKYVIGLDFGTDSCRALVVDTYTGREMATGVSFYPRWKAGLYCDAHNNRYRQHPLDYIESMIEAVHIALSDLKEEEIASICGLCFDTTGSTPALTDKAGMPLALCPEFAEEPDAMFILWKDHTAVREAEQINALINKRNLDYLLYEGGTYSSEWVWSKVLHIRRTKLLQKSEMRKNMVMDLIYRGFIYAANYSESHFNPRRSQIKTELRYLFVTTLNR